MTVEVFLVSHTGVRQSLGSFVFFEAAVAFALKQADEIGLKLLPGRKAEAMPSSIDIYTREVLEISVRIIRGGLRGDTSAAGQLAK